MIPSMKCANRSIENLAIRIDFVYNLLRITSKDNVEYSNFHDEYKRTKSCPRFEGVNTNRDGSASGCQHIFFAVTSNGTKANSTQFLVDRYVLIYFDCAVR